MQEQRELTLDELDRIFDAGESGRVKSFNITGGEPFVRKNLLEIFVLLKSKGMRCDYVTTNGTVIKEDRADALAERLGVPSIPTPGELIQAADAVCLAVPTVLHALIAGELLRAGLDVLVEKPLATTRAWSRACSRWGTSSASAAPTRPSDRR